MNKYGALVGRQLQEETEVIGKKYLPHATLYHRQSHTAWPGSGLEPPRWEAGINTHVIARPD